MSSIDDARAAKAKALAIFEKIAQISSVGLVRKGDGYAVKVSLEQEMDDDAVWPKEIDGVPVVVKTSGRIRKQKTE